MTALLLFSVTAGMVACGSEETAETEPPTDSGNAKETETTTTEDTDTDEDTYESEYKLEGEWRSDSVEGVISQVTIQDDTVTIEEYDEDDELLDTYWVGSVDTEGYELYMVTDAIGDFTWESERDEEAEMVAECDSINFTYYGSYGNDEEEDYNYQSLDYSITDKETGEVKTIQTNKVEDSSSSSIEGATGNAENNNTSETPSASSDNNTEESKNTTNNETTNSASPSASTSANNTTNSDTNNNNSNTTANTNTNTNNNTNSTNTNTNNNNSGSNSGSTSTNTSNTNNNSSSSGSSGSSSGSSSSSSGSSTGTTTTACSHNYQGVVTKNATCSSAGVKTYTCSKCGASYTESIPATGNHNWQAVYKTVHHDATGHYETTPVYDGRYCCGICGWYQENVSGMSYDDQIDQVILHQRSAHGIDHGNYYTQKVQVGTTSTWVVDSSAYDEQVIDYYKCSVCGATK